MLYIHICYNYIYTYIFILWIYILENKIHLENEFQFGNMH